MFDKIQVCGFVILHKKISKTPEFFVQNDEAHLTICLQNNIANFIFFCYNSIRKKEREG